MKRMSTILSMLTVFISAAWVVFAHYDNKNSTAVPPTTNQSASGANINQTLIQGSGNIVVQAKEPDRPKALSVQVGVLTANRVCKQGDIEVGLFDCSQNQKKLNYSATETASEIKVMPNVSQLIDPVEMLNGENIGIRAPQLDFKIVNNTRDTFVIDRIDLKDVYSIEDKNVFLHTDMACTNEFISINNHSRVRSPSVQMMYRANAIATFSIEYRGSRSGTKRIAIAEENNLKIHRSNFTFSITPALLEVGLNMDDVKSVNEKYNFSIEDYYYRKKACSSRQEQKLIENTGSRYCADLTKIKSSALSHLQELQRHGVQVRATDDGVGAIVNPIISGSIEYDIFDYQTNATKRVSKNLSHEILLASGFGCGDGLRPSESYTAKLMDSGSAYEVQIPVSHTIRPGESDRIMVSIGADHASFHKFVPVLRSVNGTLHQLKAIHIYIP